MNLPVFFFEGAGRREAVDAIFGCAQEHGQILCLTGSPGVGRTAVLECFLREANREQYAVAFVTGDILMSAAQCCETLLAGLGGFEQVADPCAGLRQALAAVQASGCVPVVLVDDAHELGEETLRALLGVCSDCGVSLVLAGDHALPLKISGSNAINLEPLGEIDCAAFISGWMQGRTVERRASRRTTSRLHRQSAGLPGALLPLLETVAAPERVRRVVRVPIGHVVFIVAAIGALVWLLRDAGKDSSSGGGAFIEIPVALPDPSGATAGGGGLPQRGRLADGVVPRPVDVVSRPAPPARALKDDGEDFAPVPAEPAVTTIPAPLEEPRPVVRRYTLDEEALLAEKPSRYTLQLFAGYNEQSVHHFATRHGAVGARSFRVMREGLPWYVVVGGNYRTKDDARSAIANLPGELQKLKPWPRSFQGIQDELRRRPD